MIAYPSYHSTLAKSFLGVTIPASTTPDPTGDLKIALDTLFNHPNTAPFISKQLIQRFVTSNPSPAYVQRVATVFANDGAGVRGNMAAVINAVLTDPEARTAGGSTYGKVREPVIRMANWMRTFNAQSTSGSWLLGLTNSNTSLNQAALYSSSVFNFWRPGYSPPNTQMGAQNPVVPEFQAVDEVAVAGYANTMQGAITSGVGTSNDINSAFTTESGLASDANALTARVNQMLFVRPNVVEPEPRHRQRRQRHRHSRGLATQAQIAAAQLNRAKLAVYMTMVSPEFHGPAMRPS